MITLVCNFAGATLDEGFEFKEDGGLRLFIGLMTGGADDDPTSSSSSSSSDGSLKLKFPAADLVGVGSGVVMEAGAELLAGREGGGGADFVGGGGNETLGGGGGGLLLPKLAAVAAPDFEEALTCCPISSSSSSSLLSSSNPAKAINPPAGPPFFAETPKTPILAPEPVDDDDDDEGAVAGDIGIESLLSLSPLSPLLDRRPVARETADFKKRHGVFGLLSPFDAERGGEGGSASS